MNIEVSSIPKVSVIVPVYNNESYLRETLNSLKNQTFSDFEVLCIDDGSIDASSDIIREYEAFDERFHYIFQENSGAGPARNHGMHMAKGEFIAFLDGDDFYSPNYLEKMVDALDKTKADVCICEIDKFNSKTGQTINISNAYQSFDEGKSYQTRDLVKGYFNTMGVICWNKVFRHSFIKRNPYEFQSIRHCNDVAFVCSSMAAAETVCFVKKRLAHYRVGTGESTQDKAVKYPLCAFEAYGKARENVYLRHKNDEAWQKSIDSRCADAFFNTFLKDINDEKACKEAYDAFKNKYEHEWKLNEKPIHYFGNKRLRFRMWCYRRTSFEGMKIAYLKLSGDRAKRKSFFDRVKTYAVLFWFGLLKR